MLMKPCANDPNSDSYYSVNLSISSISLVSSLTVVILNYLVPNIRKNQNLRYISYLSLANSFSSMKGILEITLYWTASTSSTLQLITVFMSEFSTSASCVWAILFAVNVLNILSNNSIKWVMNEKLCLCLGYGLTAVSGLVSVLIAWSENIEVLFNKTYTLAGCLVPLCIVLWIYFLIIRKSRRVLNPESSKNIIRQIIVYPMVLTLILILRLIGELIIGNDQCVGQESIVLLSVWYVQGVVDAIYYGMNPTFRQELRAYWSEKKSTQDSLL